MIPISSCLIGPPKGHKEGTQICPGDENQSSSSKIKHIGSFYLRGANCVLRAGKDRGKTQSLLKAVIKLYGQILNQHSSIDVSGTLMSIELCQFTAAKDVACIRDVKVLTCTQLIHHQLTFMITRSLSLSPLPAPAGQTALWEPLSPT